MVYRPTKEKLITMHYTTLFAYPFAWCFFIPLFCFVLWYKLFRFKPPTYRYSLTDYVAQNTSTRATLYRSILFWLRMITLIFMIIFIAKPEIVDLDSKVKTEGIDIMLVIDVSSSMHIPCTAGEKKSRIKTAKEEAITFIKKRTNDAIGLVLFAATAVSRCPCTTDKTMLMACIDEIEIGMIDESNTALSSALLTAENRLRHSNAKSKIIILLTDGQPTNDTVTPETVIEIAQKLGIRIYTIGIGDNQTVTINHPWYGTVEVKTEVDKTLLTTIATQTNGQFFQVNSQKDMRSIYTTIDQLEKTVIDSPYFTKSYTYFMPFILLTGLFMIIELILKTFVWFGL